MDDEKAVLVTTAAILRAEGYDVDEANGGEDALVALARAHYDLVLTDMNMPRVDGLAVLDAVQKRSPATVTLVITGYGSVSSALQALRLGAYEYLLKPTEIEDLKQAVRRSLERKRLSEIDTLYNVSQAVTQQEEAAAICATVARAARDVLGVTGAEVRALAGLHVEGQGSLDTVLRDASSLHALTGGHVLTRVQLDLPDLPRSFVVVPGLAAGKLACVIYAHNGDLPFEFHASALRFLNGLAAQAALALQNAALIAELRRNNDELAAANRKLRELDRLKSQFLSVATHELRTPLSVILGYNSMLADSLRDRLTPEEQQNLAESVAACKRLIRLVNSMLDISQIESGRMRMELEPLELRPLVQSLARFFQPEAAQRSITLAVELPARLPRIAADAERIQQVLINLIGNALKFTPAGGKVTVSARQRGAHVEFAVADTGPGIAAEEQEGIFDEFVQAGRRGRSREGYGLGLAITRRIVEAHGGKISVASAPGRGSTFKVTVPAAANAAKTAVTG